MALPGNSAMTDKAIATALRQVGKPYVWGAEGPNAFDCSGLLWYAFKQAGYSVGERWVTTGMLRTMQAVPVSAIQPGDFLFPHTGHVVMYIGNNKIVEAPNRKNPVRTDKVTQRKWFAARRFAVPGNGGTPVSGNPSGEVVGGDIDISGAFGALTNQRTWLRVGMALGGGILIILAFVVMAKGAFMPAVKTVAKGAKVLK